MSAELCVRASGAPLSAELLCAPQVHVAVERHAGHVDGGEQRAGPRRLPRRALLHVLRPPVRLLMVNSVKGVVDPTWWSTPPGGQPPLVVISPWWSKSVVIESTWWSNPPSRAPPHDLLASVRSAYIPPHGGDQPMQSMVKSSGHIFWSKPLVKSSGQKSRASGRSRHESPLAPTFSSLCPSPSLPPSLCPSPSLPLSFPP